MLQHGSDDKLLNAFLHMFDYSLNRIKLLDEAVYTKQANILPDKSKPQYR